MAFGILYTISNCLLRKHAIAKVKEMAIKIAHDDEIVKGPQVLRYFDNVRNFF